MKKDLGLLEELELIIPGFRGYKQKELIREDDALIRNHVFFLLKDAKESIEKVLPKVLEKHPNLMEKTDDLRKELIKVSQKIKHASRGYSGLFDRIKIREEELKTLLEKDYHLVKKTREITETCNSLPSLVGEETRFKEALDKVEELLISLENLIDDRERIFKFEEVV
ncbi:MAG: hypothetical protein J7L38_01425 [Thermoproteales archaeon]|nr:hypothetical protein [Thermoproteales archaeon]